MREIYKTQGLILSNFRFRESDKSFLILSPDLGLCFVRAGGVRSLKSKLRFILQDLSLVDFDLVKGRGGWRITNASLQKNWFRVLKERKEFLKKIAEIKNLLLRMTDSDFELDRIFKVFNQVLVFFENLSTENQKKVIDALEIILLSQILYSLGYIDNEKWPAGVLEFEELKSEILDKVLEDKKFIYSEINQAIKESQL